MSEFFLVLPEGQTEYGSLEEANATRTNINRHVDGKAFRVYRCKRNMHSARHFPKAMEILAEIHEKGLTDELRDRITIILTTVGNRNDQTPHLTRRWVPEFERVRQ